MKSTGARYLGILRLRLAGGVAACALAAAVAVGAVGGIATPARGQIVHDKPLPANEGVEVLDKRGTMLPLDATLRDAQGRERTLADYFDGTHPVIVVPAYYDCPLLCPLVLDRVKDSLRAMKWTAGQEFRVLTFSFDHTDTTAQAKGKQDLELFGYDRKIEDPNAAWAFCTTDAANARAICDALGFYYRYLPESGQFSHHAAIFFCRPDGTVNGFIEGLEYAPQQLTLALQEAGDGKLGSLFDRVVFSCYHYDPQTGKYVISPMNVMRVGASGAGLALGVVLVALFASNAHRKKIRREVEAGMEVGSGGERMNPARTGGEGVD